METSQPITYRNDTWTAVCAFLGPLSLDQLNILEKEAGIEVSASRKESQENLLERGGFLLIKLNLHKNPSYMTGTYFMYDIYEYVLDEDGARQLAAGEDVTVRYVGGDFAEILPASQVIEALSSSDIFDQRPDK